MLVEPIKQSAVIDKQTTSPVLWGNGCQSWYLQDKDQMGIFHMILPPQAVDEPHIHLHSEQFVYVLRGTLGVLLNGDTYFLTTYQGILIPKKTPHKVFNQQEEAVEFILFASPNHPDDRVEV
jgi:mannose-6-phosphate isomerase-like protein (cupin superfamily)